MQTRSSLTRREFLQTTLAASALAAAPNLPGAEAKGQGRTYKVALIGCGGRGKGAAEQALQAGQTLGLKVQIVALADYFRERALQAASHFGVAPERCFGGPKCYEPVMETDADMVLLVTAPLFRPIHLEAAVKAGKHAFIEKPVAVDPPGCRRVIAAGEEARKKGLSIISGTEMRHDFAFRKTHQALAVEKAFGRLFSGRVSFCIARMFADQPINPRTADDLVRTWQNWIALSGDHLVEQHVHNIDIANWFCGRPPVSAVGFGGRARRNAGDMYDFFSVDYHYGQDLHIHSMCRQVTECWDWVGHEFIYEKGKTNGTDYPNPQQSPIPKDLPQGRTSSHQEQIDLLYYVSREEPMIQAREVAESSATAVMGRLSAYTGKQVLWEEMMVDPQKNPAVYHHALKPTAEDFELGTVVIPKENEIPRPGRF